MSGFVMVEGAGMLERWKMAEGRSFRAEALGRSRGIGLGENDPSIRLGMTKLGRRWRRGAVIATQSSKDCILRRFFYAAFFGRSFVFSMLACVVSQAVRHE